MTTDLASSGSIVLDPTLPFGLVKTTAKTVTYTKDVYPALSVKTYDLKEANDDTPKVNVFAIGTPVIPNHVSFERRIKIRGSFETNSSKGLYVCNVDDDLPSGAGEESGFGFAKEGATVDFSSVGGNILVRDIDTGEEWTVAVGGRVALNKQTANLEIEAPIPNDAKYFFKLVKYNLNRYTRVTNLEVVTELTATMYHDGALERGDSVLVSFDVYDSDGATVLGTINIEGVVSPYDFSRHDVRDTYKAGAMKSIVAPVGTWALKSGATGVYARLSLDSVRVGGVEKTISDIPNLFDTLEIDFMHKDEYENIVAMPVCELITGGVLKQSAIPFQSSDEELPDGKGGNCAVVVYVKPLRVSDILGKRIEIATSLWIVM